MLINQIPETTFISKSVGSNKITIFFTHTHTLTEKKSKPQKIYESTENNKNVSNEM